MGGRPTGTSLVSGRGTEGPEDTPHLPNYIRLPILFTGRTTFGTSSGTNNKRESSVT